MGDLLMVYKKLQRLAGFTARVTELIEGVDVVASQPSNVQITGEDDGIHFDNITVHSPDGRLLVKDLSLSVKPGESVFITGANGAGKTSIFRVLAGLWRATSGTVVRPAEGLETTADGEAAIFYVPQRPYLVSGTLRDQVMYPLPTRDAAADAKLWSVCNSPISPRSSIRAPRDWVAPNTIGPTFSVAAKSNASV